MSRWLTKEERRTLSPEERQALRRERKLAKWPDTNGKPPWIGELGDVLESFAQRASIVLIKAAMEAVKAAALSSLSGGQARHNFAVDRLLEATKEAAEPLLREEAASLIADAYDVLDEEGVL